MRKKTEDAEDNSFEFVSHSCDYTKRQYSACLALIKIIVQLEHHFTWVWVLPLHYNRHNTSYGLQVLDDIIDCTKPEEDKFLTRIGDNAVNLLPHGETYGAFRFGHGAGQFGHDQCWVDFEG